MHVSKKSERGKKTKKKTKKRSLFFSSINHSVIFLISTNPDAVKWAFFWISLLACLKSAKSFDLQPRIGYLA